MKSAFYFSQKLRKAISKFCEIQKCVVCGEISAETFCKKCFSRVCGEICFDAKRCRMCGRILISEDDVCMKCRKTPILKNCGGNFSLFGYHLWQKRLLFEWKMNQNHDLSEFFAEKLHFFHQNFLPEFALAPVPPRPGKIAETGWDQIESLSRFLECDFGEKVERILVRNENIQQKKLSQTERLTLKNRYFLKKGAKVPKKVLIFDDIKTTGATLENVATVLKEAGANEIRAFTAFCV